MAINRERMKKRTQEVNKALSSKGSKTVRLPDGMEFWNPEEGPTLIDIIPFICNTKARTENWFHGEAMASLPYAVHRNVGANNVQVVCLGTWGEPCPICEESNRLRNSDGGWDAHQDEIKSMRASWRDLYIIRDRDESKKKFHVFDISRAAFGDLLAKEYNSKESNQDYQFPQDGRSLEIRWGKKTLGKNSFLNAERIDFPVREEDYEEGIENKMPDLSKCLVKMSYDNMNALFHGLVTDPDDEPATAYEQTSENKKTEGEVSREAEKKQEETSGSSRRRRAKGEEKPAEEKAPPANEDLQTVGEVKEVVLPKTKDALIKAIEETTKREELCNAAFTLGVLDDIPNRLKWKTNSTEAGIESLKSKLIALIPDTYGEDQKSKAKSGGSPECPDGGTFGKDVNQRKFCDDCEIWEACLAASSQK